MLLPRQVLLLETTLRLVLGVTMITTLVDIVLHSTTGNDIVLNLDISNFTYLSLGTYHYLIVLILNTYLDQSCPTNSCSSYSYTLD
jgi:hypothetical protein